MLSRTSDITIRELKRCVGAAGLAYAKTRYNAGGGGHIDRFEAETQKELKAQFIDKGWSVTYIENSGTGVQAFVAMRDREVIVSVRGLKNWKNLKLCLQIAPTCVPQLENGGMHSGVLRMSDSISAPIMNVITEYLAGRGLSLSDVKDFMICGHSMGGAISLGLAVNYAHVLGIERARQCMRVVAFGEPAVLDEKATEAYNELLGGWTFRMRTQYNKGEGDKDSDTVTGIFPRTYQSAGRELRIVKRSSQRYTGTQVLVFLKRLIHRITGDHSMVHYRAAILDADQDQGDFVMVKRPAEHKGAKLGLARWFLTQFRAIIHKIMMLTVGSQQNIAHRLSVVSDDVGNAKKLQKLRIECSGASVANDEERNVVADAGRRAEKSDVPADTGVAVEGGEVKREVGPDEVVDDKAGRRDDGALSGNDSVREPAVNNVCDKDNTGHGEVSRQGDEDECGTCVEASFLSAAHDAKNLGGRCVRG